MLSNYFLLTRADESDQGSMGGETKYRDGPVILVNLGPAYTAEPLYEGKSRPTCIAYADAEVLVMETIDEINSLMVARKAGHS